MEASRQEWRVKSTKASVNATLIDVILLATQDVTVFSIEEDVSLASQNGAVDPKFADDRVR